MAASNLRADARQADRGTMPRICVQTARCVRLGAGTGRQDGGLEPAGGRPPSRSRHDAADLRTNSPLRAVGRTTADYRVIAHGKNGRRDGGLEPAGGGPPSRSRHDAADLRTNSPLRAVWRTTADYRVIAHGKNGRRDGGLEPAGGGPPSRSRHDAADLRTNSPLRAVGRGHWPPGWRPRTSGRRPAQADRGTMPRICVQTARCVRLGARRRITES